VIDVAELSARLALGLSIKDVISEAGLHFFERPEAKARSEAR
jgi:hypothetical protein